MQADQIEADQLNPTLTEKLNKNPKYAKFIAWLKENGGLVDQRVSYPAAFGPHGYVGVSCNQKIQAFRAVIAIPKKVIIDIASVRSIELYENIMNENPRLFLYNNGIDTSFNILTLFLVVQRLKGEKSFYYPYFQAAELEDLLVDWNKNELALLQNRQISEEIKTFKDQQESNFMQFLRIFRKYDNIFPQEINNEGYKKIFQWAYQFVMSRAFGWSVPSTALIPFADMLNHHQIHLDHCIVDIEGEGGSDEIYEKKKQKVNMNIFKKPCLVPTEQEFKKFKEPVLNKRERYINKHKQILQKEPKDKLNALLHIVSSQYKAGIHKFRQLEFAQSSCSEDNDTDDQYISDFAYREQQFKIQDKLIVKGLKKSISKQIYRYWKLFEEQKIKEESEEEEQQQSEMNEQLVMSDTSKKSCEDSASDDQEYKYQWLQKSNPQNIFFILFPKTVVQKNQQLYNFYGRRSNRFLLTGYNFAKLPNKYDSFAFRLVVDPQSSKLQPLEKLIFHKFIITKKELKELTLTKEIRLKSNRINKDLINHCRCLIIASEIKQENKSLTITIPFDREIQKKTLEFYQQIVSFFLKKYTTTLADDRELLKNPKLPPKYRTAVTLRVGHKLILKQQIKLIKKCTEVLGRWKNNKISLEQKEMEECMKIKQYINSLQRGKL